MNDSLDVLSVSNRTDTGAGADSYRLLRLWFFNHWVISMI